MEKLKKYDFVHLLMMSICLIAPNKYKVVRNQKTIFYFTEFSAWIAILNWLAYCSIVSAVVQVLLWNKETFKNLDIDLDEAVTVNSLKALTIFTAHVSQKTRCINNTLFLQSIYEFDEIYKKYTGLGVRLIRKIVVIVTFSTILGISEKFLNAIFRIIMYHYEDYYIGILVTALSQMMNIQLCLISIHYVLLLVKIYPRICAVLELIETVQINDTSIDPVYVLKEPKYGDISHIIDQIKISTVHRKNASDRIQKVLELYEIIRRCILQLNEAFYGCIMCQIIATGLTLVLGLKRFIIQFDIHHIGDQSYTFILIVYGVIWIVLPIECCQRIKNVSVKINEKLLELLREGYTRDANCKELERLWIYACLEPRDIYFDGSGFFDLDRTLLAGVAGSLATYILFIIQNQ